MQTELIFLIILGSANYAFLLLAYLMRNMLYLRLITVLSSISAIIYYSLLGPLWVNLIWEIAFIGVNIFQIIILIYQSRELVFSNDQEKKIYNSIFKDFTASQFRKIYYNGKIVTTPPGEVLIEQGTNVKNISVIVEGFVSIIVDGKEVAQCRQGNFIGEISFISGRPATATVKSITEVTYLEWEQNNLRALLESDSDIRQPMQKLFNMELIHKLILPGELKGQI